MTSPYNIITLTSLVVMRIKKQQPGDDFLFNEKPLELKSKVIVRLLHLVNSYKELAGIGKHFTGFEIHRFKILQQG